MHVAMHLANNVMHWHAHSFDEKLCAHCMYTVCPVQFVNSRHFEIVLYKSKIALRLLTNLELCDHFNRDRLKSKVTKTQNRTV